MSALQAFRYGMNIAVYATSRVTEPVEYMTPNVFRGSMHDEQALTDFARNCDLITLENEFLDSALLARVCQNSGTPLFPSPESFRLIEDKLIEKQTFANAGIPVAPFSQVSTEADLTAFGDTYGWPYILKSAKGGYDGYGNATVRDLSSALEAYARLGGQDQRVVIAEAMIPFRMELAVMVARNHTGTAVYPCVESVQQGHICKEIIAPARVPEAIQVQAQELAKAAVEAIDGVGLFGFEFFLTHNNEILLNESAPRPHNSGHYTIEGCVTSQFENHIRAVCGLPLGPADMLAPTAVMINILGSSNGLALTQNATHTLSTPNAHLHVYGKLESRSGRKMAHLTLLGNDTGQTLDLARKLAAEIQI
jgi:5-(carboxyamino)imidazole ribonucleotide synthase